MMKGDVKIKSIDSNQISSVNTRNALIHYWVQQEKKICFLLNH